MAHNNFDDLFMLIRRTVLSNFLLHLKIDFIFYYIQLVDQVKSIS